MVRTIIPFYTRTEPRLHSHPLTSQVRTRHRDDKTLKKVNAPEINASGSKVTTNDHFPVKYIIIHLTNNELYSQITHTNT